MKYYSSFIICELPYERQQFMLQETERHQTQGMTEVVVDPEMLLAECYSVRCGVPFYGLPDLTDVRYSGVKFIFL